MSDEIYYFGCNGRVGHYFFTPGMKSASEWAPSSVPWGWGLDDKDFIPKTDGKEVEGRAVLCYRDGWTALSFWDRTVDHRGNSKSIFVVNGVFEFDKMLALAHENFPEIFERLKQSNIEVEEWKP